MRRTSPRKTSAPDQHQNEELPCFLARYPAQERPAFSSLAADNRQRKPGLPLTLGYYRIPHRPNEPFHVVDGHRERRSCASLLLPIANLNTRNGTKTVPIHLLTIDCEKQGGQRLVL